MDKNVLVVYASKYGATKEIAVKIGDVLRQAGLQVDVWPGATEFPSGNPLVSQRK